MDEPSEDDVLVARALQACYAMVCASAGEHQWTEPDDDGVALCVSCGTVALRGARRRRRS